jgi:L-lactate utilization protein LutB
VSARPVQPVAPAIHTDKRSVCEMVQLALDGSGRQEPDQLRSISSIR